MTNHEIDHQALAAKIEARLRALPGQRTANVPAVRREFSKRLAKAPSLDPLGGSLVAAGGGG